MKHADHAAHKVDPKLVTRPAGTKLKAGKSADLVKEGKQLWNDKKLSTNGLSCNSCHKDNAAFNATFAKPYPHTVKMAHDQAGIKTINLDEVVQFCLAAPMAGKPFPWDSQELAALTAYTAEVQKTFKPKAAHPGGGKMMGNPCGGKTMGGGKMMSNPCGGKAMGGGKMMGNPCAKK
ncbi:MAG TPA: hypothetical protein ENI80_12355 [Acidiferrobacteraceae bacterium]|nr:hypothetical protein [Acidiferrobacteraceae bacterium]